VLLNIDWRSVPNAPEPGTRLCALNDLAPGAIQLFHFAPTDTLPAFQLIVQRHDDTVNAYVNQCPHQWLPMQRSDGSFLKWSATELMCAHHSAVFDLADEGRCSMGPCQGSNLIRVAVVLVDGDILLEPSL
jgi:nitrite reductase/ring-hydroxylating ferredoxin subunit